MNTDPTLKPNRTADWYMDVVWPLLPVPGEFDGMDACDQLRWRSVVRLAIEYVLCGERGTPPSSKTPHCPKGDGPCIRGCKNWECRDGWPDDPTLKPDIAALKKRLAEDPGFAAEVTGDRPLRRNVDGVCTRSTCECEREGLGDQCIWLKPVADHWSDCATNNAPAYPAGPCDCIPTPAMCRAAVVYLNGPEVYENLTREVLDIEESIYREVWLAMQAAAPNLPPNCKTPNDKAHRPA